MEEEEEEEEEEDKMCLGVWCNFARFLLLFSRSVFFFSQGKR